MSSCLLGLSLKWHEYYVHRDSEHRIVGAQSKIRSRASNFLPGDTPEYPGGICVSGGDTKIERM